MANKDEQPFTLVFTSKEWKEAGEGREPMWTWREHANSSQHRKAPDTTKYHPRIVLQRGSVTSDSSLEVDSGPFEWMLLASSLNHQITAYLVKMRTGFHGIFRFLLCISVLVYNLTALCWMAKFVLPFVLLWTQRWRFGQQHLWTCSTEWDFSSSSWQLLSPQWGKGNGCLF